MYLRLCVGVGGSVIPADARLSRPGQNLEATSAPRLGLGPGVSEPGVLMISRREVAAGDLPSVLSRLKVFVATREGA